MTHWHLHSIDWLDALPGAALVRLREQSVTLHFGSGQTVFDPRPNPESVFVLERGLVRIYRLSAEGDEFTLGFVKPGEVFGELAAFDDRPRESFAQAVDSCTVLKVPKPLFVELVRTVPDLGYSVTKQIERRFNRIETRAEDLVFRSVEARLAGILLLLDDDFGDTVGGRRVIRLHLTQAEFATLVGATRPTVNLTFRKFHAAGLTLFEKGHAVILDREGLGRVAHSEVALG